MWVMWLSATRLIHPENQRWRGLLYAALDDWYADFKPPKTRGQELLSSGGPALGVVDGGQNFFANNDDFVDRVVTATTRHPRARGAAPGDDAPH